MSSTEKPGYEQLLAQVGQLDLSDQIQLLERLALLLRDEVAADQPQPNGATGGSNPRPGDALVAQPAEPLHQAPQTPAEERRQHVLDLARQVQTSRRRVLGLNPGALIAAEDFDAPLPVGVRLGDA